MIHELTKDNFNDFIQKSTTPVVVDFWAPWCGPCKILSPIVDEVASEKEGSLSVAKLNVDDNPEVSIRYGIQSIPTLGVFVNGEMIHRIVGALPKTQIYQQLAVAGV